MTALFLVLILTLAGGVRLWLAGGSFSVTSGFCVCVSSGVQVSDGHGGEEDLGEVREGSKGEEQGDLVRNILPGRFENAFKVTV